MVHPGARTGNRSGRQRAQVRPPSPCKPVALSDVDALRVWNQRLPPCRGGLQPRSRRRVGVSAEVVEYRLVALKLKSRPRPSFRSCVAAPRLSLLTTSGTAPNSVSPRTSQKHTCRQPEFEHHMLERLSTYRHLQTVAVREVICAHAPAGLRSTPLAGAQRRPLACRQVRNLNRSLRTVACNFSLASLGTPRRTPPASGSVLNCDSSSPTAADLSATCERSSDCDHPVPPVQDDQIYFTRRPKWLSHSGHSNCR